MEFETKKNGCKYGIYNDNFENAKKYLNGKAQIIIADIPYNIGVDAYASNPQWWKDGECKNGTSELAEKQFFNTDSSFNITNYFNFCTRYLMDDGCMIMFCAFEQLNEVIENAKKAGFNKYIPLVFIKNNSAQVLKANMRIVGACEYGLLLYRNKLPKFNNIIDGQHRMIKNWFEMKRVNKKIHPTEKPIDLLEQLIRVLSDEGDLILDPVAGSCSTLIASYNLKRSCVCFEIDKNFIEKAIERATEWTSRES